MKQYLHKELVEKERSGSDMPSKKWAKKISLKEINDLEDFDSGSNFASSARKRNFNYKNLSDNLGPLHRYLDSQVGRLWNDVWSEVKSAIPKGMHGDHIKQHVFWYVELHPTIFGDEVYSSPLYGRYTKINGLYVHPNTGILCRQTLKSWRQEKIERRQKSPIVLVGFDKYHQYEKYDDIWYWCAYEDREKIWNDLNNATIVHRKMERVLILKKQLNKKEMKKLQTHIEECIKLGKTKHITRDIDINRIY